MKDYDSGWKMYEKKCNSKTWSWEIKVTDDATMENRYQLKLKYCIDWLHVNSLYNLLLYLLFTPLLVPLLPGHKQEFMCLLKKENHRRKGFISLSVVKQQATEKHLEMIYFKSSKPHFWKAAGIVYVLRCWDHKHHFHQ